MLWKLYSVLDLKAGFFKPPFCARSNGEAIRMLAEAARDPDTQLAQYPDDFALYELATFNDVTGAIDPIAPGHVCGVAQLLPRPRPVDTEANSVDGTASLFDREAAQ